MDKKVYEIDIYVNDYDCNFVRTIYYECSTSMSEYEIIEELTTNKFIEIPQKDGTYNFINRDKITEIDLKEIKKK